ncbi:MULTISPECIES: 23S rRNA (pseudouridine(1915)-N(3))-methyltransferase RlmH [Campylobacter]|uniref:Ribosomal RNA large subunit methyltransferase H n=1 Tax=Campylobacter porcelli TaxID=1660073 RepID=A0ABU7M366_9BACT|nr:23S rRNA (pseudouridine(1915)-N(3))-methyltransferase RlmH [Campylobacter sp. P0024]MCR8678856.1 23S rRNA (pseudouridine(1915)-N(3))-methyltransferase RlmH [Campylobacter sp. RM19072]MEE3744121.1 23S rRNA (pseudouridine(1915)-N(3))-methyltransferase RlmH [Campylobacter sp. CX2-4855-23]
MQILVHCLQKLDDDNSLKDYVKMSSKWANIKEINKFNSQIAKAQTQGQIASYKAYEDAYTPHLNGYCVGLDERGDMLDSFEFAKLLKDKTQISFFIGGAYGLGDNLRDKMDKLVSLSRLTLAHKIAKLVLYEQIFRALCINFNHPYHK